MLRLLQILFAQVRGVWVPFVITDRPVAASQPLTYFNNKSYWTDLDMAEKLPGATTWRGVPFTGVLASKDHR